MAALFGTAHRNWLVRNPPEVPKSAKPLTFAILGAAAIGPSAILLPAKNHPDVVIQTVAARDPVKAKAYAQKHGIPDVAKTYQDILDNPSIDCVYIPLPNGLHYEWAQRALKAGKHVLLEKPSVNNSTEAERLFYLSLTSTSTSIPSQPVFLEATHYFFHPAWAVFMAHVTPNAVARAKTSLAAPRGMIGGSDIRYDFNLGGGAMMDLGAYTASALACIFGSAAEECVSCETGLGTGTDPRCDRWYRARYRFPNGGIGEMEGDLNVLWHKLTPGIHVTHKPVVIAPGEAGAGVKIREGEEVLRTRKIHSTNFAMPSIFHSITVVDEFAVQEIGEGARPRKTWKTSRTLKAYTWRATGLEGLEKQPGEPYWPTYRYQLEQFVNKVRGRDTPQWVDGGDSVVTMRMIDMAYTAAKLPLRPSSEYK